MKKVTALLVLAFLLLSNFSFAQMYVKLGGGYSLDFNSQSFGTNTTTTGTGTSSSYEAVYGSLGSGVNVSGAFGYEFSPNFAGELGFIYKLSKEFESKDQFGTSTSTETVTGSFFGIVPTVVISASSQNVKPFVKIGLLFAFPSVEDKYTSTGGGQETYTPSGNLGLGLVGGAGILVPMAKNINLIAELNFVSLTWKPAEAEIKTPTRTYTVKLEDEWTSADQFTTGPEFIPFSNAGINVGIQIGF